MTIFQTIKSKFVSWSFLIFLGANLVSYDASAQNLTIPNTFTSGTAAVAAEVNENFDAVAAAVNGDTSTADVLTFFLEDEVTPAAGDVVGTAELSRIAQGVNLTIHTTMLTPGAAYTVWWIIFNNPSACDPAGCGLADLGTAAVEGSVMNATGRVADSLGDAWFSAFLPAGFIHTNPVDPDHQRQLFGPGLQNVAGADIQIIVRCHGPSTGSVEQISTLDGDCVNAGSPSGCFDAQFAVFPQPM